MNEIVRRGRQRKHLTDEHHFKADLGLETPDNDAAAVATPAVSEAGQEGAYGSVESETLSVPIVHEAVFEDVKESSGLFQESPVEERIHALMEQQVESISLNGWRNLDTDCHPAEKPPLNGMPVRLSENTNDDGVVGFWKKTRAFANTTRKWESSGMWCNFNTGLPLTFEPKYWKDRYAV